MKTIGIVLAGGESKRFGSPKAFAQLDGKEFYTYAENALSPFCDDVIISVRPEHVNLFPKRIKTMVDTPTFEQNGPLSGIYSVMKTFEAERYIVLPCDMPYMTASIIGQLLHHHSMEHEVTSVKWKEQFYPLVSIWNASVFHNLEDFIRQDKWSVMKFYETISMKWIDATQLQAQETDFRNMNRPDV